MKKKIAVLATITALGTAFAATSPTIAAEYDRYRDTHVVRSAGPPPHVRGGLSPAERAYLAGKADAKREMIMKHRMHRPWWFARKNHNRFGFDYHRPYPRWW